jgi:hypothetical protein
MKHVTCPSRYLIKRPAQHIPYRRAPRHLTELRRVMDAPEKAKTACDQCHRCKLKCSRNKPQCQRCESMASPCTYSTGRPLGKPRGSTNRRNRKDISPAIDSQKSGRLTRRNSLIDKITDISSEASKSHDYAWTRHSSANYKSIKGPLYSVSIFPRTFVAC